MQETRKNCFGSKNVAQPFFRRKQLSTSAEMQQHSCLTVSAWRRVVLRFFDPKQLLRVSCILWCYYPKCYSITFQHCWKITKNEKKKVDKEDFQILIYIAFTLLYFFLFIFLILIYDDTSWLVIQELHLFESYILYSVIDFTLTYAISLLIKSPNLQAKSPQELFGLSSKSLKNPLR